MTDVIYLMLHVTDLVHIYVTQRQDVFLRLSVNFKCRKETPLPPYRPRLQNIDKKNLTLFRIHEIALTAPLIFNTRRIGMLMTDQ